MNTHLTSAIVPLQITDTSALGRLIRLRRCEQLLRIDDAASLSGVSVDLLSRLENGKGSVRLDKLLTVLDGLGLAMVIGPKEHPQMSPAPATALTRSEQP